MYEYNGIVHRVVDGDTMEIDVDLGFECYRRVTFRILELDTYESRLIGTTTEYEKKKGIAIKEFVEEILTDREVQILSQMKKGFYKRYLCQINFKYNEYALPIYFRELMVDLGCDKKAGALPLTTLLEGSAYPSEIVQLYEDIKKKHGILE